jgi:hypothetical protein
MHSLAAPLSRVQLDSWLPRVIKFDDAAARKVLRHLIHICVIRQPGDVHARVDLPAAAAAAVRRCQQRQDTVMVSSVDMVLSALAQRLKALTYVGAARSVAGGIMRVSRLTVEDRFY